MLLSFLKEHPGSFGVDIPKEILTALATKGDTDNGLLGDGKVYMSTASAGAGTEEEPIVMAADRHLCAVPCCGQAARTRHFACSHLLCRRCHAALMHSALTRDPVSGVVEPVCPMCRKPRVVGWQTSIGRSVPPMAAHFCVTSTHQGILALVVWLTSGWIDCLFCHLLLTRHL